MPHFPRSDAAPPAASHPVIASLVDQPADQKIGHRNFVGILVIALLVFVAVVLGLFFGKWAKPVRQFFRKEKPQPKLPTIMLQGPGTAEVRELKLDEARPETPMSPSSDGSASPCSEKVAFEVAEITKPEPTQSRWTKAFRNPWRK
ncbi:hypothetical protein EVG20_g6732 [Dentipellis fragilis]|uniref:Uncharacterized protein n=1 Tax=Dentipellis fragilis TaxID=205917 RepID=A0A4Y9YIJ3_9AGAM|nr:hypothetical protein EVG20_g6732 [Dentipellis fragilis]